MIRLPGNKRERETVGYKAGLTSLFVAFFGYILAGIVTGPAGYNMITVSINGFLLDHEEAK